MSDPNRRPQAPTELNLRPQAPTEPNPRPGAISKPDPGSGDEERAARGNVRPEHVLSLRLGHGANCSSVGSVIDTLFLGAAAGGAIFAAVCAAMRDEPVRIAGRAADDDALHSDDALHTDDAEGPP